MTATILLVDDVRLFLEMQKEFLQYTSAQIVTATNGKEALDAIGGRRPDLVLMDIEMPEMDGITCCRTIKSSPQLADIPVVMITAKGDESTQRDCRAAGCDAFLTKPSDRSRFLEQAGRFVPGLDRRATRTPVSLQGLLRSRGATIPCTLHNLSLGGAFITAPVTAEVDRVVETSFTLPDGSAHELKAKVIWSKGPESGKQPCFGINFILLPAQVRDALASFLKPLQN